MATTRSRKLFVNLAVSDLKKSMEFFSKLGFEFNPKFTDDKAACMILSEEAFVMLLREPFFDELFTVWMARRPFSAGVAPRRSSASRSRHLRRWWRRCRVVRRRSAPSSRR